MSPRLLRDPDGAWARATTRQRLAGLILGVTISLVPLVIMLAFIADLEKAVA